MYKWFFMGLFICVATNDEKLLIFNSSITVLCRSIENNLMNIDSQYKSTRVASDIAFFAARRFHNKSLTIKLFNIKFNDFFSQLRCNRIVHKINQDQLSEQLRLALKKALFISRDIILSSANITFLEIENPRRLITQDGDQITFSSDQISLSECIQNHLILTGHPEFLDHKFTESIADFAARRYYRKSLSRENFYIRNRYLFSDLQRKKMIHDINISKLSVDIELLVRQAVEDCAMDKHPLAAVPTFEREPVEIAQLLNFILVKWSENLHDMIQSWKGRAVLRRYAGDAYTALVRGLNNFQNDAVTFRLVLRFFWKIRAQEIYDAYSKELPYIVHKYSSNYPTPHMVSSNNDAFINRKNKSFSYRNPLIPVSYLNRILNIHKTDRPNAQGNVDFFDVYNINGITSSEYYFENQLIQFYQILFFFLEIQARGICTDEDDVYDGPLPNNLVPEQIQAIVYDDDVYSDYLLDERFFYQMLIGNDTHNEIAKNLFESARVLEENLILLRSNILSTSGIQSSSKTPTTMRTIITTAQSLKRKSNAWKNSNGKCFPSKQVKMSTISESGGSMNNSVAKNLNQVKNLLFHESCDNFARDSIDEVFNMCFDFDSSHKQDKIDGNNFYGYMMYDDNDFNEQ